MLTLLLSEPLHFGDYGGLPMKILWAALDIITIIVLGSGLYLWLARGRRMPAQPDRTTATLPKRRLSANDETHTNSKLRQIWQAPTIVAAVTLVGLVAALVGDGWKDAVSWVALTVPLALIAWKWGCR